MPGAQVTVLVCTHDGAATLGDALDSAFAQTAAPGDVHVLVVDDGSTDGTAALLRRRADPRLQVLRLPVNEGLVGACNAGLAQIRTPWFMRLDSDDTLMPDAVEALLDRAAETGAGVVTCDRWEEHPGGRRLRALGDPPAVPELVAAGVLMPAERVRAVGGYRRLFWEEYDLYLRLLEHGDCRLAHVPRPLYVYRVGHDGAMTSDDAAVAAGWDELRDRWTPELLLRHGFPVDEVGVPGRAA